MAKPSSIEDIVLAVAITDGLSLISLRHIEREQRETLSEGSSIMLKLLGHISITNAIEKIFLSAVVD